MERIKQRSIPKELIRECIESPDEVEERGICRCVKRLKDEVLVVVYRKEETEILVITAYRSSKVGKYLRG